MEHGLSKYTNERCRCEICRAANAAYHREYRAQDELARWKHQSRALASGALRRGRLTQQPCEVCGGPKAQMHHDDYLKPLEVRWLCRKHHSELHKEEAGI